MAGWRLAEWTGASLGQFRVEFVPVRLTQYPDATVTAYYEAIGRDDTSSAARLLAPEVRQQYEPSPDSDWRGLRFG
jgi:hypothetical protein